MCPYVSLSMQNLNKKLLISNWWTCQNYVMVNSIAYVDDIGSWTLTWWHLMSMASWQRPGFVLTTIRILVFFKFSVDLYYIVDHGKQPLNTLVLRKYSDHGNWLRVHYLHYNMICKYIEWNCSTPLYAKPNAACYHRYSETRLPHLTLLRCIRSEKASTINVQLLCS